jgi:hypothetical protein
MTVLRLAAGLSIWFTLVCALVLSHTHLPDLDGFEIVTVLIMQSYFLLMLLRWALVLTLLIRTVRAVPFRWLPRWPAVQIGVVTIVQFVLGVLSLVGWLALVTTTQGGDRVLGVILHLIVPALMLVFLARRAAWVQGMKAS